MKAASPVARAERPGVVRIERAVLDAIEEHARRDAPLECCGLLIGTPGHVRASVAARNARASSTRFLVDPEDHFAALRRARTMGADVVGVYHSHPGTDAVPSATDIAGAEGDSHLLWLIVSLRSPGPRADMRVFRPAQMNFEPVEFVVVG